MTAPLTMKELLRRRRENPVHLPRHWVFTDAGEKVGETYVQARPVLYCPSYVYCIGDGIAGNWSKIGLSRDPGRRLNQICSESLTRRNLQLLAVIPVDDDRACESALHDKYKAAGLWRGLEWFALDAADIAWLQSVRALAVCRAGKWKSRTKQIIAHEEGIPLPARPEGRVA